ncbi:MAG: bifunctional phosphoribosyl-AMP cyclohydrolase/phosphoribosyl-ATP diphosphatase HisIE [Cytophagales bacterium]|nr:MAG: bifunctional phosphoribosyl-AMP cyclohydrolase/phosphoribosyl-ATP diphosphatase HisIE [Cytophagales bacterium]
MENINFDKGNGMVVAIVQDFRTRVVLMTGFMNKEAYEKTILEKKVTFFSRTKNRLWTKGETSGNFLNVQEIKIDCDGDALLIKAIPEGETCHTGADTCWFEKNEGRENFINYLKHTIRARKENPSEESYTSSLFKKGINKIAQKVGEEAVELVIEAKDNNKELFLGEAADLLFHYMVLLEQKGYDFDEVIEVLEKRHHK